MSKYGSIAYSSINCSYSYSYGCSSESSAQTNAINACAGSDVKVLVTKNDSWIALAIADNGEWAWGASSNFFSSRRYALESIKNNGAKIEFCFNTKNGYLNIEDSDNKLKNISCPDCGCKGRFKSAGAGELLSDTAEYFDKIKSNPLRLFSDLVNSVGSTLGENFICVNCNKKLQVCVKCAGMTIFNSSLSKCSHCG